MVKIKAIVGILHDLIGSAERGVPYSLTFDRGRRLSEAGIVLTGDQWKTLEDVLKESFELYMNSWIIPPAKKILHFLGEGDHEWNYPEESFARCKICGVFKE